MEKKKMALKNINVRVELDAEHIEVVERMKKFYSRGKKPLFEQIILKAIKKFAKTNPDKKNDDR